MSIVDIPYSRRMFLQASFQVRVVVCFRCRTRPAWSTRESGEDCGEWPPSMVGRATIGRGAARRILD
jgi:hypothetical protein